MDSQGGSTWTIAFSIMPDAQNALLFPSRRKRFNRCLHSIYVLSLYVQLRTEFTVSCNPYTVQSLRRSVGYMPEIFVVHDYTTRNLLLLFVCGNS